MSEHLEAKIHMVIVCPKCNGSMERSADGETIHCQNRECEMYGRTFVAPTMKLIEVEA